MSQSFRLASLALIAATLLGMGAASASAAALPLPSASPSGVQQIAAPQETWAVRP
jgi:hypothetical protein